MAILGQVSSNSTGLRYCEETSLGVLPVAASQIWYPAEPNSYSDFGGTSKLLARKPINASRQNQKGVIVDFDAAGGWNQDMTQSNMLRLLRGFFFAAIREQYDSQCIDGTKAVCSAVVGATPKYTMNNSTDFTKIVAGHILFGSGFAVAANNGLHPVVSKSGADLTVSGTLVDETPPATARVQTVGFQFVSATVNVDVSNALPRLVRASGAVDWTTLGIVPGQFVFVGADSAGLKFVNAANNGYARVHSVTASYIQFDKTTTTMVTETGTGLTIQLFFGKVLKNELDTTGLISRKTFSFERDLVQTDTGTPAHQTEVLSGAIANQLTLNVKQGDKLNADLAFINTSYLNRTQAQGPLSAVSGATAPTLVSESAFNTTDGISRMRMVILNRATGANPSALFAYIKEFSITVNNNVKPAKAVSVLGAFDASAGNFEVSGKVTAYFSDVAAIAAVTGNSDVSFDFIFAQQNAGLAWDIPLIALGDGKLNIQQDESIEIPLDMNAAADAVFSHTLSLTVWNYLPTAAM